MNTKTGLMHSIQTKAESMFEYTKGGLDDRLFLFFTQLA